MRSREQLLVGLDVEEEEQIVDISGHGVNIVGFRAEERIGVGVEDGSEGVEDEAGVVQGDLEGLGEAGRVDPASGVGG